MDSFKKGEDIKIELEWLDASGANLAPSTLVDYEVRVYSVDDNEEAVMTFAKTPSGEQKQLVVEDDLDGVVSLKFARAWTAEAEATNYFIDVYWYYNDPEGEDGKSLDIVERVELMKLID